MTRRTPSNNGLIEPNELWRTISESGGPDRRSLNDFRIPSDVQATSDGERREGVSHAAVARAVWGDSNVAFDAAIEAEGRLEQESRPHVFVLKRRFRRAGSRPPDATSRLIGEDEFSEIYAATEFAASAELWFDSTVTISWRLMGEDIEANVQKHFKSFTKCLREWFATKRIVPCAYIYAHEHGSGYGAHTHLALHVPVAYRREFRLWAMGWAERQLGNPAPRSVRVRIHAKPEPWLHWMTFSYLMKGFDTRAVIVSARNSFDQRPIYLGDVIAAPWRNPGDVKLRQRVGCSRSLGPSCRANGVVGGLEYLKSAVNLSAVFPVAKNEQLSADAADHRWPPFRSKYEDGGRDVRLLYPPEFLSWCGPFWSLDGCGSGSADDDVFCFDDFFPNGI